MKQTWRKIILIIIILLGLCSVSHAPEKRSREKQKAVETHVMRFTIYPKNYNEQRRIQLIEEF